MRVYIVSFLVVLALGLVLSAGAFADISPGGLDLSALGDYASDYRVNTDQPENTNNCTMNSMEGANAPGTPIEDPNGDLAYNAPYPFVDDWWDVFTPTSNDPDIPSRGYYPGGDYPGSGQDVVQNTPEPSTILLVCVGMCGLIPFSKRKKIRPAK
jgi:hypothetical protein